MRQTLQVTRHHTTFYTAVDSYYYVVGMMATLSMAGRSALCENGKFPGDRLFGARSDPRTQDMNAMQPAAVNGARVSPPMVTTLLRAGPRLKHALARPVFRRKVTSITMMRAMHVTQAMAEFLGLYVDGTASVHDDRPCLDGGTVVVERKSRGLQDSTSTACKSHNHHLEFRSTLTLRDSKGSVWPVVYEASTSNRQYHRRLSEGWAAFCRHHGVEINDTIEFRRCLKRSLNDGMLAARVVRRRRGVTVGKGNDEQDAV
jgi:hypothetical protein